MNLITWSNQRLHSAITSLRIVGRNVETMAEFYEAKNARRAKRARRWTEAQQAEIFAQHAAFGRVEDWKRVESQGEGVGK